MKGAIGRSMQGIEYIPYEFRKKRRRHKTPKKSAIVKETEKLIAQGMSLEEIVQTPYVKKPHPNANFKVRKSKRKPK